MKAGPLEATLALCTSILAGLADCSTRPLAQDRRAAVVTSHGTGFDGAPIAARLFQCPMMAAVAGAIDKGQIGEVVVFAVAVDVMDIKARRNLAVSRAPHLAMEAKMPANAVPLVGALVVGATARAVDMPASPTPFDAAITQTGSPSRR